MALAILTLIFFNIYNPNWYKYSARKSNLATTESEMETETLRKTVDVDGKEVWTTSKKFGEKHPVFVSWMWGTLALVISTVAFGAARGAATAIEDRISGRQQQPRND